MNTLRPEHQTKRQAESKRNWAEREREKEDFTSSAHQLGCTDGHLTRCNMLKTQRGLGIAQRRCVPVQLEGLQSLGHLKDEVEALVWLTSGKWQNLTLNSMVLHVLQHEKE